MRKPLVSVILLNWNGIAFTKKCIASLKKQSFKDFEIVVVDNGSKDNSVEELKKISGIRLVCNSKNLGFAQGCNVGVRSARASTYIALLNNDTEVDADWLRELVVAMDENPRLGEAMSLVHSKYGHADYVTPYFGTSTLMLFVAPYDVQPKADLVPIFSATGGAMIYRRSLVEVPFDKDYFIYNEDSWLGWLLRLRGYDVAVVTKSKVYHEGEATIKKNRQMSGYFVFLGERNRLLNLLQCYSLSSLVKLLPVFLFTAFLLNVFELRKVPYRFRAYAWITLHVPRIVRKRRFVQQQRKVSDRQVTQYMSGKLFDPNAAGRFRHLIRALNRLALLYCRLVGIAVVELRK